MKPEVVKEVIKYIRSIHNKHKKNYAIAYYNYLWTDKETEEPEDINLSYMAKQAVRMNLTKLCAQSGIKTN